MPARIRLSSLEVLLPNLNHDNRDLTDTLCTTDTSACKQQATICSHSQDPQQQRHE
jgi:hypothetical protein